MSTVKFIKSFVNKNPRNLERLRLQPRPSGWVFETDRFLRNSIYRIEFVFTTKHTTASIVHFEDGIVLSASTKEPSVAAQLYSCGNVNAAYNIGRLFANRCKMVGITSFNVDLENPQLENSERQKNFFKALSEANIKLKEDEVIPHTHINDPNLIWEHFTIKNTRETKLDELDLSLEPGKGVC